MDRRFQCSTYLLRRQILKLVGAAFYIFVPDGRLAFYAKLKAFKLREDIRLYDDEGLRRELLTIKARQIIDFSAAYDVFDPVEGVKVGAFKRRGFHSIIRDEWIVMDADDREIGSIQEDSMGLALLRRFFTNLVPQSFHCEIYGRLACTYKQKFNPFIFKMEINFTADPQQNFDQRMGLAAAVLLGALEGRQD